MSAVELTDVGRAYAERMRGTSIVARVALNAGEGWPQSAIDVAIRLMNVEGDGSKLTDEERTIWAARLEVLP